MVKAYVYPADLFGCGYYRLIWVSHALQEQGYDVTVVYPAKANVKTPLGQPLPSNTLQGQLNNHGDTVAATAPADADVMVLQRITHKHVAQSIPIWRSAGIAVVIDVDDDLSSIHPSNPAHLSLHPTRGKENFSWQYLAQACYAATMVTTSTPTLINRYAQHGRGRVIPNHVPASYLSIRHPDSCVIGWGGTVATHPDDLQVVGRSVAQVMTETGVEFRNVGPGNGIEDALRLRGLRWSATGGVLIGDWPHVLADNIGIGIAPLAQTMFNSAKSGLKPLEYSALGIPVVMSPLADYARLWRAGIGLLANKPKDWLRELRRLVIDDAYRRELGAKGRDVAATMTIEENAWRWWEAWTDARILQDKQPKDPKVRVSNLGRTQDIRRERGW